MAAWSEMAVVGRVARAHGRRGEVIVNLETDFPEVRFRPGAVLFVDRPDGPQALSVSRVRFQGDRPILALAGVDTIDEAEALAGLELRVPRSELVALPAGMFYRHDLVGCRVETGDGGVVGVVSDVEGTAAGSRLVVQAPSGEVLIPLAAAICTTIDPGSRRIVINPPAGLVELNSRST